MECFFVELNLRKRKWLISCSYNLNKNNISKHIEIQSKNLDLYSSQYKSNIIIGDHHNPSCIGLILTNSPCRFQGSCVVEKVSLTFIGWVATTMKTTLQKLPPK